MTFQEKKKKRRKPDLLLAEEKGGGEDAAIGESEVVQSESVEADMTHINKVNRTHSQKTIDNKAHSNYIQPSKSFKITVISQITCIFQDVCITPVHIKDS